MTITGQFMGNKEYFYDIIECINRIQLYSEKMQYNDFLNDIKTQDAIIRNIQII
jgi:uncharacterized protein with HEPN domain